MIIMNHNDIVIIMIQTEHQQTSLNFAKVLISGKWRKVLNSEASFGSKTHNKPTSKLTAFARNAVW